MAHVWDSRSTRVDSEVSPSGFRGFLVPLVRVTLPVSSGNHTLNNYEKKKVEIQWVRPIVKNKTKTIAGKRESPREGESKEEERKSIVNDTRTRTGDLRLRRV